MKRTHNVGRANLCPQYHMYIITFMFALLFLLCAKHVFGPLPLLLWWLLLLLLHLFIFVLYASLSSFSPHLFLFVFRLCLLKSEFKAPDWHRTDRIDTHPHISIRFINHYLSVHWFNEFNSLCLCLYKRNDYLIDTDEQSEQKKWHLEEREKYLAIYRLHR